MINIVIPIAGDSKRFKEVGITTPKPFIKMNGITMIERVVDNLYIPGAKYILITRTEHLGKEYKHLERLQRKYNCNIVSIDNLTEGAACTVLFSSWLINNDTPLLIANSDQIIDITVAEFIEDAVYRKLDGSILTFKADHEKWSYAKLDADDFVTEVREKEVISEYATVGLYYYSMGKFFVNSAVQMIANNERTNNEFYVAPAYNYAISTGLKIGVYNIHESQMHGTGTPEDLKIYMELMNEAN